MKLLSVSSVDLYDIREEKMKKYLFGLITLMILVPISVLSETLFELPDLARPSMFIVDHDRIYILEKATVYVHSLKDGKRIKKFGKAGEGPREFKYDGSDGRPLSMSFFNGKLIVNSEMKMSFFDKNGNYISENRVSVDRLLFPVNGKYLGIGPVEVDKKKQNIAFMIYRDDTFKDPNVIFVTDVSIYNPSKFMLPISTFTYKPVYKGNIYVNSSSDDFRINVFNTTGKKIYSIKKEYPKVEIPSTFREEALQFFRTSPRFKSAYEYLKKALVIRDHFPPIRDMQLADDHIYVLTFKRKGELWQLIKLDLEGNEKGEWYIPLTEYEYFTWYPIFYSVYKGKVYSLIDDADDEIWKVHVTEFK